MSHITLGALILAGGQNRRMGGSPKALLPNGSGALILDGLRAAFAGFDEKLLSTNTPELAAANMALLRAEYAHHQGRADVKQVSVAERMMESANTPCTTGETP